MSDCLLLPSLRFVANAILTIGLLCLPYHHFRSSKRAVQILNVIAIVGNILAMIFISMIHYDPKAFGLTDQQAAEFQDTYTISLIIYGVGLLVNILVICGASMYNACLIMFGVLWILVELGFSIYYQTTLPKDQYPMYTIIGSVVWDGLILYPHIVLISEIWSGIMSPENYARERFSCCCV